MLLLAQLQHESNNIILIFLQHGLGIAIKNGNQNRAEKGVGYQHSKGRYYKALVCCFA